MRRRIIRILAAMPLLLCLMGCAWSYFCPVGLWHSGVHLYHAGISTGYVYLSREQYQSSAKWVVAWGPSNHASLLHRPEYLLGFGYTADSPFYDRVCIPFWFPVLVFSGVLWLIWQKTAPPKPGRAFPVETSAPTG